MTVLFFSAAMLSSLSFKRRHVNNDSFVQVMPPCLLTIVTIRAQARSRAFTLLALAWPLALAFAVSLLFYQTARALTAGRVQETT